MSDLSSTIDAIQSKAAPLENPYLVSLRDGTMSRDDFLETQIQFLFAVVFFSRPMLTLGARLPRNEMRLDLLRNAWDEHGGGDLNQSHEGTFLDLLGRLGIGRDEIERRALWPEIRGFNAALHGISLGDDPLTALAVFGMIEDLFAVISADLGRSILSRGWLQKDDLGACRA